MIRLIEGVQRRILINRRLRHHRHILSSDRRRVGRRRRITIHLFIYNLLVLLASAYNLIYTVILLNNLRNLAFFILYLLDELHRILHIISCQISNALGLICLYNLALFLLH